MKKLYIATKKSPHTFSTVKKLQIAIFLLALLIGYAIVPMVQADLPPETYYQGIDTGVNGDDERSAALPIGFDFTFFGNTYSQFYVSSNGFISFNTFPTWTYINDDITDTSTPNNYIAPFWDDVTVYNGQDQYVYYRTIGTAPNRQLIVAL